MMLSTLVFVLAVSSGCLAAQSDRSRHDSRRSGPIRSVPVAADIKRDADFDCPEEFGYYPHPTDCTLYYVCVFGGALLESCTGGLMYSHELQTCDWPRNVGCDATGAGAAVVAEDVERISERERDPPPPPPRRNPPPPPPRAQPNPVVTSRGQPKFNRDEYEKQQQLYAEVDDLPPVEEIETDRQQRVYRGQPSTIGQVQKDRDGYASQVVSSGRSLNSNVIPASISQNNGKIGSFSFGTQVDERRTATATQAPQTYREDTSDNVTDSLLDVKLDILTNEVDVNEVIEKPTLRRKREVVEQELKSNNTDEISKRSDSDEVMEYIEIDTEPTDDYDEENSERGKRQIRYYLKNGLKGAGKNWGSPKPVKFVDLEQIAYSSNNHNTRHQSSLNGLHKNNLYDASSKPYTAVNSIYSTANPFASYQKDNPQAQRPFKASLPDPVSQRLPYNPLHTATQIITKSPPISALKNNENPFLAGGFYNNAPKQNSPSSNYFSSQTFAQSNPKIVHDSSLLPSTIVTGKPISTVSPHAHNQHRKPPQHQHVNDEPSRGQLRDKPNNYKRPSKQENYENDNRSNESAENDSSEENSSENDDNDGKNDFKFDFPDPPYEFTHPSNKYADIENPFANPNFDFDAFLDKLRNDHYSAIGVTTQKSNNNQNAALVNNRHPAGEVSTASSLDSNTKSSINYQGMSTPRPFSTVTLPGASVAPQSYTHITTAKQPEQFQQLNYKPQNNIQISRPVTEHTQFRDVQQSAGTPLDAARPKLKPPNFRDERILPINYNFNRPIEVTQRPYNNHTQHKGETQQIYSITQRPFVFTTGTGLPILLSTPKLQYLIKQEKHVTGHPQISATGKPYFVSTIKPQNYLSFKQSTPKPLTTIANEQLAALQQYWKNPSTEFYLQSTPRPTAFSNLPKLENLFSQTFRPPTQSTIKNQNILSNNVKDTVASTTKPPPKRRPIPKPSPEMNDYYYDEEDEQYYEPPVKSIYMPSSEVRPQRPPMAQNYEEYSDSESYEDDDDDEVVNITPQRPTYRQPSKSTPESATKNHNDVSVVTKSPHKNTNAKIPVPVMVDFVSPTPTVLMRPEVSNYIIMHHSPRNKTIHIKKPTHENGPYTAKPPKYLNQTTLRPYTVRHRLAKPTTMKEPSTTEETKQQRGRIRHHNIVAQTKSTTPRDNHNQETRFTKTKHDGKTNSLEPIDNVTPSTYTASPRPKMLYNGSQNYSPDQYDPFYAVYDEDGELYKDTDYVQQYNTASLRPAVQQTYRGTPPPARRPEPVQYTPRPSVDDYDDTLIQGQINNQNQFQAPVRHSTRGEGNELGYEHPSSVKTTIYEAPSISTTPSTTSTSTTTTYRPTTAPYTEAMTPSRYSPRSSTDENLNRNPSKLLPENPSDGFPSTVPPSSSLISLSSLAKPFEKTDNTHRLKEHLSTEKSTHRHSSRVTNKNNNIPVEVVRTSSNENKKVVSLTSGFSIRRNSNNTNNPYTLTVLTRPFDNYQKSRKQNIPQDSTNYKNVPTSESDDEINKNVDDTREYEPVIDEDRAGSSESSLRRSSVEDEDIPVYTQPKSRSKVRIQLSKDNVVTQPPTTTTKYYLKTVIKRPAPFASTHDQNESSTENTIDTEALIESGLRNVKDSNSQSTTSVNRDLSDWKHDQVLEEHWDEPVISPYRSLNNLRNDNHEKEIINYTTSTEPSTRYTTTTEKVIFSSTVKPQQSYSFKPAYYNYKIDDEEVPDHTTEVFSGKVKSVIKAFLSNFDGAFNSGRVSSTVAPQEEKVVNIGFQKKMLKYIDNKPARHNVQRVHIVTEPPTSGFSDFTTNSISNTETNFLSSSTRRTTTPTPASSVFSYPETTPMLEASTNNAMHKSLGRDYYTSKFNNFVSDNVREPATSITPEVDNKSLKFRKVIEREHSTERNKFDDTHYNNIDNELTKLTKSTESTKTLTETERSEQQVFNEIASTTSTTKSTTTNRVDVTSTTKSLSFPTRASRVNPAIKLAATNPGVGRRSYQSTKCSSDNSLQPNSKCDDTKYQRPSPSSTRGRGSAHYSTLNGDREQPQQQQSNRGTPPTRSRPTLKPSTAIVSKATEFVDVYSHPPRRPSPVYPQPTPDKTAAKCRKDVCLLPDCYCGGKDIPGDLELETVPQIVLLTFDDSVNDLNKVLYADLFEKGRVNPNGCPISATFYVSHEWTDYSQVQNLYAAGHEMASHTISHSFGEQFSQKKWNREVGGQREILAAYGGVKLEDVRGMRAPFLSVGGNKMFKMLYDSNFTYDSSMPVYENRPPSWPYTLDYKLFHDCMIPPCPTKSYPGVWEVPMVMWQDLNGGRCSMGDACANPPEAEGVYKMLLKNFDRHYTTNRAPFGLFYHAAWFTQPHHKEGFIMFLDFINRMQDVWIVTNWQALQWVRDPTPISRLNNFQPFQCNYPDRPKKCNNPKVCNLWHKSGVRYMRTCQPCPEIYPWTGKTGIRSSRIDNDIEE